MNILITGGGGFVGHHLVDYLLENTDWNISVIESFKHGGMSQKLSYVIDKHKDEFNRINIVTHDLSTPIDPITSYKIGKVDVIVNVASKSSVDESIENPVDFINNNINLQLNMLEYARSLNNLKTFIQISTDEVFGPAEDDQKHSEWQEFIPSNPYSASKASQESICHAYWRTYDLPIVITNTMNMFGERQSTKAFIPKTIEHILNDKIVPVYSEFVDGKLVPFSRFYLYIKNQTSAIKFLIDYYCKTPHRISDGLERLPKFNITDGHEFDNDEIVKMVAKLLNVEKNTFEYVNGVKFRPGHDKRYDLNGNKLIGMGWKPPYSFEESIEKTVNWGKNNLDWLV